MADIANLVLAVDATQVKSGAAALDGLAASGMRADAAAGRAGVSMRASGAAAAAMAADAQASARAATGLASGLEASAKAASVNTIAMRETLVVARELSRGNFTRIPGSLSLLAQGISSQGGIGAFASAVGQQIGLIKTLQNAELAEEAASASAAAQALKSAAQRAAAGVIAADTEVALAEAELRGATTAQASAAAQTRLTTAFESVTAAAAEATIAQNAYAVAADREAVAQEASAAATVTSIGGVGKALLGLTAVAGAAFIAYELFIKKQDGVSEAVQKAIDKLKKHAEEADADAQAQKLFAQTLEGVEEAIRNVTKALDELQDKTKTTAEKELDAANVALALAKNHQIAARAALDHAKAELEVQKAMAGAPSQRGEVSALGLPQANATIAGAQADLDKTNTAIAAAEAQIERAQSFVTTERAAADEAEKIKRKYDDLIEKTREQYLAQHKVGDELARQIELLKKKEELELKALQHVNDNQSGRQIDFAAAEAIAKAAGLTVTSGYRSVAEQARLYNDPAYNHPGNPVARPGMSAHNGVNGKWALDIAFAPGLSPARLRKLYGDQGVSLTAVYKESGHYHIEGSRSNAAKAENEAEREAQRQLANAKAYNDEKSRLDQEILKASRALSGSIVEQAQFAIGDINAERDKTITDAKIAEQQRRITHGEEVHIELQARSLAFLKSIAVEREKQLKLLDQQQAAQDQVYGFQIEGLKFADEMATSQAEHRKVQLEMLDIAYQQKEYDLKILLAKQQLAGDVAGQALTQAQIANLPVQQARQQALITKNTANPIEQWMQQVPHDAKAVTEALQGIAVQGFDNLASAIADVVTGTKSLGQAFKEVAQSIISDIIQMTVKMLIFRIISSALPGPGGSNGIVVTGSSAGAVGKWAKGGAFSGGNVIPFASGGVVTGPTLFPMRSGTGLMGEAGPEAVMPLARDGQGRLGVRAANNNQPIELVIYTAPSDDAWAKVENISARQIGQAAPVIVKVARQSTVKTMTRQRIAG